MGTQIDSSLPLTQVRILLTMRADFLGVALQYQPLAEALRHALEISTAMTTGELRQAIELPAQRLGVVFERGLVERILADIQNEPEPLPLLEFALTVLWQWEASQDYSKLVLSHAAYEEIGGVAGAITHHAEGVLNRLSPVEKGEVRRVFLLLIQAGTNRADTRRVASRSELSPIQWEMARYLADHRLVVTGRDSGGGETVQIVHEALIGSWGQLQQWLAESRGFRLWQGRLRQAIERWESIDRDRSGLLHGALLGEAEEWSDKWSDYLTEVELFFLQSSTALRDEQAAEAQAQRQYRLNELQALAETEHHRAEIEGQTNQRLRWLLAAVGLFFLLALATAGLAYQQRQVARRSALLSQSLNLAASAQIALSEGDTDLALAANQVDNRPPLAQAILPEVAYSSGTVRRFAGHEAAVNDVVWSADGQTAVSVSGDQTIVVWDVGSGEMVHQLGSDVGHGDAVKGVAFAVDDQSFFSVGLDRQILRWDVTSGEVVDSLGVTEGHDGGVTAVAVDPTGRWLLTGGVDQQLILWDVVSGELVRRYQGHEGEIISAVFADDGQHFLSGGGDWAVHYWDVTNQSALYRLEGHSQEVTDLLFFADGTRAISTANDVFIWDLTTGELAEAIQNRAVVASLALTIDEQTLFLGSSSGVIFEWDIDTGTIGRQLIGHKEEIHGLRLGEHGRYFLSGSVDHTVRLWDLWDGAEIDRFVYPDLAGLLTLDLAEDEQTAIIGTGDGDILRQPLQAGAVVDQFPMSADWLWGGIYLLPDQQTAVVASGSRFEPPSGQTLHLFDMVRGEKLPVPEFRTGVSRLDLSEDGRWVLLTDLEGAVWLWDLNNLGKIRQIEIDEPAQAMGVEFGPDGKTALVSFDSGNVYHINLVTGEEIGLLQKHIVPVRPLLIHTNGTTAFSGAFDQKIEVWDLNSHTAVRTLEGHQEFISQLRLLPQHPSLVLSVSADKTMVLWDWERGQIVRRYRTFVGNPLDIRVSADGRTAYTVEDREAAVLRVWRLDLTDEALYDWIATNRYVPEFSCQQRVDYNILPLCDGE